MPLRMGRKQRRVDPRPGFRAAAVIERPRGLRGELKALPLTDFPERFAAGARVWIRAEERTIASSRWTADRVYLTVLGIDDREAAETLRGELVEIPDEQRPPADQGLYYIDDIEGSAVSDVAGRELGRVREVLRTGANDVWIVDRGAQPDLLIPALRDVVKDVDVAAGAIVVDLPDGLLAEPHDAGMSADGTANGGGV